jgi:very-short-patch-repair endonuclease/predicted transcriptional regulator of viral defense system
VAHDVSAVVGPDGWITWEALTARVDRKTVTTWVASGALHRIQPGIYTLPPGARNWHIRLEAAARACDGMVSHRSALALWELLPADDGPIHLAVDHGRSGRGSAGVVVHRSRDLSDVLRRVNGLPVCCVERALVDAWGRPAGASRADLRAAAITAVRRRLCSARDLARELDRRPCLPGRAALAELVGLLADGCQSELEIWGCMTVLRAPGMPPFRQQRRMTVAGETFLLDAAYDDVQLAVEMDGTAYHGSRDQRERDIRRDALLATIGWQTLRFSFARMTRAPQACRRDLRAVYDARLRLLGGAVMR